MTDESGRKKQGKKPAGAARQYPGSPGKAENGHVSVSACPAQGDRTGITDAGSCLPGERADDRKRRREAGIPGDRQ